MALVTDLVTAAGVILFNHHIFQSFLIRDRDPGRSRVRSPQGLPGSFLPSPGIQWP